MTDFLDIFLKSIALLGSIAGCLWALTKYVFERGLIPATELNLN